MTKGFQDWDFDDISIPFVSTTEPSDTSSEDVSSNSSLEEPIEELSYSITFSPATTTNVALDATTLKGVASEDAQVMNYGTIEKIYREAPDAIKFGTTSAMGVLAFTLPDNLQVLSISVEAKTYTNDATIMLVDGVEQVLTNDYVMYEFDCEVLETAIVELKSKNTTSDRFFVKTITIVHSAESIPEPDEPVYHRVEAEVYELHLPYYVNANFAYGSIYLHDYTLEGFMISGFHVSIDDTFGLSSYGNGSVIHLDLATDDSAMSEFCDSFDIMPGSYGRYLIHTEQVAGQPVAYDYEPIYEYVLVE